MNRGGVDKKITLYKNQNDDKKSKGGCKMGNYYGLDLEKVEAAFEDVLKSDDDKKIADFAKEVIPLLIEDSRKTRMEFLTKLLKLRR